MNIKILEPIFLVFVGIFIVGIIVYISANIILSTEGFENKDAYKLTTEYKAQVKLLQDAYSDNSSGKVPVATELDIPESEQILANFYALGCRFTGYIGPNSDPQKDKSFYDPDIAVKNAVDTGCRVFVLEIDYIENCSSSQPQYFPTLVVRDVKGRLHVNKKSTGDMCTTALIQETCEKINFYAFSKSCQNYTDPVIIVLYFLNQPPGAYDSVPVLTYFSNVAKALSPFRDNLLGNELSGTYNRQSQEGQLMMNKITDYNGKVLIFSNANASGFRDKKYASNEDLDYLTNVRLSYTQTKLGISDNAAGSTFGLLETVESFLTIPVDRANAIVNQTKLKWTICLSSDPFISVTEKDYKKITETYGVHCIPIILSDTTANKFMFTKKLFKTHGFIPKPKPLRYIKPPVIIAAEPSKKTDANGGMIRAPKSR